MSRARLLWVAAALLLEAIATDTPGEQAWPVEPLTNSETQVLMASLDQLSPERSAWLQEVTSSGDDSLKQVSLGGLDVRRLGLG